MTRRRAPQAPEIEVLPSGIIRSVGSDPDVDAVSAPVLIPEEVRKQHSKAIYAAIRSWYTQVGKELGREFDPEGDLADLAHCRPSLVELWNRMDVAMRDPLCSLQGDCLKELVPWLFFLIQDLFDRHPRIPLKPGEKAPAIAATVDYWIRMGFSDRAARKYVAEQTRHLGQTPGSVKKAHERFRTTEPRRRKPAE